MGKRKQRHGFFDPITGEPRRFIKQDPRASKQAEPETDKKERVPRKRPSNILKWFETMK